MAVNPFPTPYPAPTVQLAYTDNFKQPLPGSVDDSSEVQEFITGVNPNGKLTFGLLATFDSSVTTTLQGGIGQGAKHPASSGDVSAGVLGIVVRSAAMESQRDNTPPGYLANDPANIMRVGRIWDAPEVAVTKHDAVYVRVTANGALNTLGAFRNDSDSGNAVLVPNAKWYDTQATPGGPARIEFNFQGQ